MPQRQVHGRQARKCVSEKSFQEANGRAALLRRSVTPATWAAQQRRPAIDGW